jgi:hypothetical protein
MHDSTILSSHSSKVKGEIMQPLCILKSGCNLTMAQRAYFMAFGADLLKSGEE